MEKNYKQLSKIEANDIRMNILDEIDDICSQEGLVYWLDFGTLIGAIRHNGFIPWDDDVDVGLPRTDYEAIINYYLNNQTKYKLTCSLCGCYRIVDTTTKVVCSDTDDMISGIWVDLFPYDSVSNNNVIRLCHIRFVQCLDFLQNILISGKVMTHTPAGGGLRKALIKLNRKVCKVIPMSVPQAILSLYGKIRRRPWNDQTRYVSSFNPECTYISKRDVATVERHRFENRLYYVPHGYHQLLTMEYGDYMTPPPEKERVGKHCFVTYQIE